MLLSKFVCADSEICFESNLNERLTSLGFCDTRNQILFRNVSCVASARSHHPSSDFGCTPVLWHESFPGGFSEWVAKSDSTSVHQIIRVRPLHLHVLQWVRRKDHCWARERMRRTWSQSTRERAAERQSASNAIRKGKQCRYWLKSREDLQSREVWHISCIMEKCWTKKNVSETAGRNEKSELMDTLESEEDREKKRKLEETCEGKLTRLSEDAMFLRREIIDALKGSDVKMESYSRKTDEKMENFPQNLRFSRSTITWDELSHRENERTRRWQTQTNQWKIHRYRKENPRHRQNTKARLKKARERMLTGIRVRQWYNNWKNL